MKPQLSECIEKNFFNKQAEQISQNHRIYSVGRDSKDHWSNSGHCKGWEISDVI